MKNEFYKFKRNMRWRKESDSLLLLHPQERRLLIFNKKIAQTILPGGLVEFNEDNANFIKFLKKINAINKISKPIKASIKDESTKGVPAPLNVTIQITNKCNLNCVHCHNNKQKMLKTLSMARYKKLIDELSKLNVFNINISGGEPLLVSGIVDIVQYAVDKGMSCTMSTNLTMLNGEMAKKMARAGLKRVHISLDSFDPLVHNKIRGVAKSFERMRENLHFLRENNIQYTMVTTLVDQSPNHYAKTIDLAFHLGARAHKTNTVVPQGRSESLKTEYDGRGKYGIKEYIKIWENKKREYSGRMGILAETMFSIQIGDGIVINNKTPKIMRIGCPAGILTCAINESGDVTPCSFFSGMIVGNIIKDKFIDVWNSSSMAIFRRRKDIAICGKCQYRDSCGGCRARAYGRTGDINREDPYCFKYA